MAQVYTLSGYPEEVIAHAFAKTSRSPHSFADMIKELDQEKSNQFHSKWVLEYGHSSIAEHVVVHLAVEDASRLAVEALESGRIASYTEQSTRYQAKNATDVFYGEDWSEDFILDYRKHIENLFALYDKIHQAAGMHGKRLGFAGYDFARFVLPLATKVNVGMTINARALRRTLCKMLASDFPEISSLGELIRDRVLEVAPTLLRHVTPCRVTTNIKKFAKSHDQFLVSGSRLERKCHIEPIEISCVKFNVETDDILAGLPFEFSTTEWGNKFWSRDALKAFLADLGEHDVVPRAFENGQLSFEILSDYGSYYDMKRHRIATLLVQRPSIGVCGYLIPGYDILKEVGLLEEYREVMDGVATCVEKWRHLPESIYLLPNAFRIRYKMDINPRELIEIVKLRGINKNGHTSYRFIGLRMLEIAASKNPDIFGWLRRLVLEEDSSEKMIQGYRVG